MENAEEGKVRGPRRGEELGPQVQEKDKEKHVLGAAAQPQDLFPAL